jgi:hypothetical protein
MENSGLGKPRLLTFIKARSKKQGWEEKKKKERKN